MAFIPHGNLYQLRTKLAYPVGSSFVVNGPDMFGYVVKHIETNESGTLHLVRGTGKVQARVNSRGMLEVI